MRRFLTKAFWMVANPIRKAYWFVFRPRTRGVKVVIEHGGKFLLTRLGYAHKKFTIPGGGVKRRETFEEAARREVSEEVGIELGAIRKIGGYTNDRQYKRDTVEVFYATVPTADFRIDGIEISEAGWYPLDGLPADCVPRMGEFVALVRRMKGEVVQ